MKVYKQPHEKTHESHTLQIKMSTIHRLQYILSIRLHRKNLKLYMKYTYLTKSCSWVGGTDTM
jgi:hypothetical protein